MARKRQSIGELINHYHSISPVKFDLIDYDDQTYHIKIHFEGDDIVVNKEIKPLTRDITWNYFRMLMNNNMCPEWYARLLRGDDNG